MVYINKETIEKVINIILNILIFIFGIFLLVAIYTGFQTRIIGNDYANFFGYSLFEVQTGSMGETIKPGDWIIIKLTKNVDRDDIITYELNGEYITHRIIEVYNSTYITKGDANSAKDEPVDQSQVVGKVVKVLPNFGIVRKTLFNPTVLVVLIITLIICNMAFTNRPLTNNIHINRLFDKIITFFGDLIQKLDLETKFNQIFRRKNNEYGQFNNYSMNFQRSGKKLTEKEYEQVEKELEKTAIYRIVSVDADDVKGEYKILVPKSKTEEEIEEELGKTALYRIISVDANEISEKYLKGENENEIPAEEESTDVEEYVEENNDIDDKPKIEKYAEIEDELGKTSIFRVISVDVSDLKQPEPTIEEKKTEEEEQAYRYISINPNEIDNTLLEIAENEMKENKPKENIQEDTTKKVEAVVEDETEESDSNATINLDLLKSKNARRGKNIIDKVIVIKKEELNELIELIVKNDNTYVYRATIKDAFITAYTDAKYYNYYGTVEIGTRGRNLMARVKKMLEVVANDLLGKYSDNKNYEEIIKKYYNIFVLIANLEHTNETVTALRTKKEYYKNELLKYGKSWTELYVEKLVDKIIKTQKRYADTIKYFLEKLETNMFNLKLNHLSSNKNMFGAELRHNLSFSKIYSDYIIDKTYNEGVIAEDKTQVLLSLLSVQLVKDMMSANFEHEYVFYLPYTLYEKERKLNNLLNAIDNEYAKNHVLILIPYNGLVKYHAVVKQCRKNGYRFALVFDKDNSILKKHRSYLYIVDYLFINKKDENMKNILSMIPEDLNDKIISEDIIEKVGDLGGE